MGLRHPGVTVLGVLAVGALTLTACTTAVTGSGRPAAGRAPGPATSSSGATGSGDGSVPSGAPPATNTYPGFSPEYRSYLFARDATYHATTVTAKGPFTAGGVTVTVDGVFGFDTAASELSGTCSLTVGTDVAQVRALGDTVAAQAPASFWTAVGVAADAAAAADGRWVAITAYGQIASVCDSTVYFLTALEPGADDPLQTGTENGGENYVITDPTTGYTTVADHRSGVIIEVRSSVGSVSFGYPAGATPAVALPAPTDIVTVPGF